MMFLESAVSFIETTQLLLSDLRKQSFSDFCDIQTSDDTHTFVTDNMSMLSVIKIVGATKLMGSNEFDDLIESLYNSLSSYLSRGYHAIELNFQRDRETARETIEQALKPSLKSCQNMNLSIDDIFQQRVDNIAKFCSDEAIYLSAWTRTDAFTKPEHKMADKLMRKNMQSRNPIVEGQSPDQVYGQLREHHHAFVQSLTDQLNLAGVSAYKMAVHDALRMMRQYVDPDYTAMDWRPSLPGDPLDIRVPKNSTQDLSDILWQPVPWQLVPRDGERIEHSIYKMGDRLYSVGYIDIHPQQVEPFMALFNRIDFNIPWRIAFLLEGNGIRSMSVRSTIAAILAFSNGGNRAITNSIRYLQEQAAVGETVIKFRVCFTTWAKIGEEETLRARRSSLARAVEGWGKCDVREESGDVAEGVACTLPGFNQSSIGTPAATPLKEILPMLPWTRPSSPWQKGGILYRTAEGKIWPYQPGSSLQTSGIDLYSAKPGSGKSVLLNLNNLAFISQAGVSELTEMPYVATMDIGPSSEGTIALVKEALPESHQHYALYQRIRMTDEFAMNVFDTQIGMQRPLEHEKAFLTNFLSLLATPSGKPEPYENTKELVLQLIDESYLEYSEEKSPKHYAETIDHEVDRVLRNMNAVVDDHTTWWEVVDMLFEQGYVHEAGLAQRYAVPTLEDCIGILRNSAGIKAIYGNSKTSANDFLIDAVIRKLVSAVREFKLLHKPTRFDLGEARVVSLDLEEVAPRDNNYQTAVMYMLARNILMRNYFLHPQHISDFPVMYQRYQEQRIHSIRETQKRCNMDEFHRTDGQGAFRAQVRTDMREGRKRNVHIALASQDMLDFDAEMIKMANSIYILDSGTEGSRKEIERLLGLSETERYALKHRVHGPTQVGSTFLFKFATKRGGEQAQLLTITAGGEELWALSTTPEDTAIRRRVSEAVGSQVARRVLAVMFPGGSALKELDSRRKKREDQGLVFSDQSMSVSDELAEEIIKVARDQLFAKESER